MTDALQRDAFAGAPGYGLGHRALRAGFALAWLVLARWTPPGFRAWRRLVLMAFGARLAPGAHVAASARVWYPPHLEMDAEATLGPGVFCYCAAPVRLGRRAVVSQGATLCAAGHDIDRDGFALTARPILIGDAAWVAAEAFVGPGVRVAEGAVLGARGAAFADLEAWTVYRGNPAVALRKRPVVRP